MQDSWYHWAFTVFLSYYSSSRTLPPTSAVKPCFSFYPIIVRVKPRQLIPNLHKHLSFYPIIVRVKQMTRMTTLEPTIPFYPIIVRVKLDVNQNLAEVAPNFLSYYSSSKAPTMYA